MIDIKTQNDSNDSAAHGRQWYGDYEVCADEVRRGDYLYYFAIRSH